MIQAIKYVDFGAPDKFGTHLFRVEIPASRNEAVRIIEDYGYRGLEGGIPKDEERAILTRAVWSGIADIARREFNDRLKGAKVNAARWHTGTNLVDRLLGKELCVLAWAAETANDAQLPVICSKCQTMKSNRAIALPSDYGQLLADIKRRVRSAQIHAGLAANRELLALYWDVGRLILDRQKAQGWGAKVIDRLSCDLQNEFPGQQGFSPRNLKYMRAFADAWPNPQFVQQPAAQIPWTHHCLLLDKLDTSADRLWYAAKALENGWSRNVLALQIDSGLHTRQGKAVTNFRATLPPPQSDLAQQVTKDPYVFDFLNLRADANERAVEDALLAHVEKFLLELGAGFALVGRQVHMEVGGEDFYLDLLFYHLRLRCFVVVDLKARDFTPEAAGKMNFYLSAVDDHWRQPEDQPSIGLILCRAKNRIIAEYALRDVRKPIGVSGYVIRLVEILPKSLRTAIPSVREIEAGLATPTAKSRQRRRKK